MTLEDAIEILEEASNQFHIVGEGNLKVAIQLSIKAIKWVRRYRPDNKTDRWSLLPGETEE